MNKKLKISSKYLALEPSSWITENLPIPNSKINLLDLACGNGRHSIYAAKMGYKVTSIDIEKNSLLILNNNKFINPVLLNLEKNYPWPFKDKIFNVVIITNYLYRPILRYVMKSIKLGGKLFYETFTRENYMFGRPNNENYLLQPQELLKYSRKNNFEVLKYEEKIISKPVKKAIQRIIAIKSSNL